MPYTHFFATQEDLIPGVEALQRIRPLQFVQCSQGGYIESAEPSIFPSFLEAADLGRLQLHTRYSREEPLHFYVLDADRPVPIKETLSSHPLSAYCVEIPKEVPYVLLTPGGLHPSTGAFWSGSLQGDYETPEDFDLYGQIKDTLFHGFQRLRHLNLDLYGPQALDLGAQGTAYTYDVLHDPWTYSDLLERKRIIASGPQKPVWGRLSLAETWDWLDANEHYAPRNPDGTPHPYPKCPTMDTSPDPYQGISFFGDDLEEEELDRLTLPRTRMREMVVYRTTFRRTNLAESWFGESDFAFSDFSEANLSGSYIIYLCVLNCKFDGANMKHADLRNSDFMGCTFEGANMMGAKLLREQEQSMALSAKQRAEIAWCDEAAPEP